MIYDVCVCLLDVLLDVFAACPSCLRSQRFDHKNCRRNHRQSIGVVRGSLTAVNGTASWHRPTSNASHMTICVRPKLQCSQLCRD